MANNMNTPITHRPELEKKYKPLFIILSIVIPVVVAVLLVRTKLKVLIRVFYRRCTRQLTELLLFYWCCRN